MQILGQFFLKSKLPKYDGKQLFCTKITSLKIMNFQIKIIQIIKNYHSQPTTLHDWSILDAIRVLDRLAELFRCHNQTSSLHQYLNSENFISVAISEFDSFIQFVCSEKVYVYIKIQSNKKTWMLTDFNRSLYGQNLLQQTLIMNWKGTRAIDITDKVLLICCAISWTVFSGHIAEKIS